MLANLSCFPPPPAAPVSFSLCDRRIRYKGREISDAPETGFLLSRAPYFLDLAISTRAVLIHFLFRVRFPYTLAPLFLTYNVWFRMIFVVLMAKEENFLTASLAYYRECPIPGQNGLHCLELVW